MFVDQARDRRTERPFLIGPYPDEEPAAESEMRTLKGCRAGESGIPVRALDTGRQGRPDTCSGTDPNSSLKHGGGVSDARYSRLMNCSSWPREAPRDGGAHTELELPGPHRFGRVADDSLGKVALDPTYHIMGPRLAALADDPEGVVLHDGRAADPAQQTLLHPAVKFEDGHFWRGLNAREQLFEVEPRGLRGNPRFRLPPGPLGG